METILSKPYHTNWIAQTERYPFTMYPYKQPGQVPVTELSMDLQIRMQNLKAQLGPVLGMCSCRINGIFLRSTPPDSEQDVFSVTTGSQVVIDLQNGNLYYSPAASEVITLGKAHATDWQYYLQYSIN